LTFFLAHRNPDLQAVPIQIADWPPVYMDLRRYDAHNWLAHSPWPSSPREIGEQAAIRLSVRPGSVVFDIGANIGLHTALLSKLTGPSGHVYAFEPNPSLLPALRKTVAGMPNATLIEFALGESEGSFDFYMPQGDHSVASLADWTHGRLGHTDKVKVQVRRLDGFGLPVPAFIKCDIEGAELMAFRGGASLLDRPDAPIILFEANVHTSKGFGLPVTATRDFLASLPAAGYSFFEVEEESRIKPVVKVNEIHSNLLAVPALRLAEIGNLSQPEPLSS
jgi:FkbM family methyltransferase